MRRLASVAVLAALVATGGDVTAQQPAGSRLPKDRSSCATCHGERDLWEGDKLRLFVSSEQLTEDVHWKNGVNCHDCHGGDPGSFDVPKAHAAQADGADPKVRPFRPALSEQTRSAARLTTQVDICGRCHAQASGSYQTSVHGHGLHAAGLTVTAVCTDCHNGHGVYPASDPRSALNTAKVSATCAACHRYIDERVQKSVHGRDGAQAATTSVPTSTPAPGKQAKPKPGCTDCHQGHDLPHPRSSAFRLGLPDRCGNCHPDQSNSYVRTVHGQLTELGYVPAAKCSDCHGSHDILPISDPASRLSVANRRETCAKCHADVTDNFLAFDPHANPRNPQRDAILYWVNVGLTGLLTTVFVIFGTHSLLWLVRGLQHVAKRGRPKYPTPGTRAYLRFRPVHRLAHTVLMTSFLGLALTGLPLRYSNYAWAQRVSWALGGFSSTGLWHRIFGIANFGCLAFYCLWFGSQLIIGPKTGVGWFRYVFGPDSPVPNRRDVSDFAKMLRWFAGLGPKPTFERWTYWEKFDLWAASADIVLIGTTGLILWFPNQFCSLLPGQALNIANLIHGKLALLATGFVFAIHFFNSNLRPEKFPMDISILTGHVSEEEMSEERPELLRRLRETGQLEQYVIEPPSAGRLVLAMLGGFLALGLGLALLIAMLIAQFR